MKATEIQSLFILKTFEDYDFNYNYFNAIEILKKLINMAASHFQNLYFIGLSEDFCWWF